MCVLVLCVQKEEVSVCLCWGEKRAAQWTHAVSCSSAFRASDPFSFSELQDDDDDGSFGARSYKIWDVHGEEEEKKQNFQRPFAPSPDVKLLTSVQNKRFENWCLSVCVCVNKSRSQFFDKGKRNYTLLFFSYFGREQQLITRTGATDYCSRHVIL